MHSSQSSKNKSIREGRVLLAICPSVFHIRNSKRISIKFGIRCLQCSWIFPRSVTQRRGVWPSEDPAVAVFNEDAILPSK